MAGAVQLARRVSIRGARCDEREIMAYQVDMIKDPIEYLKWSLRARDFFTFVDRRLSAEEVFSN